MADYGVYFEIVNTIGAPLNFLKFESTEGDCCLYDGPASIPSDGLPHRVRLADPCPLRGAGGTAFFSALVHGHLRQYAWYGDCPVWSPNNRATGPGIRDYNATGHPLTVSIGVNADTPGWTVLTQLIERVFVLMLENRSLDHMLGFSGIIGRDAQTGDPTSLRGLTGKESNVYNEHTYLVSHPADWTMPLDPGHEFTDVLVQLCGRGAVYQPGGPYPPVNVSGYVANYAATGGAGNPAEIMKCYSPAQLPVLNALAQEFAVCDDWRASMPGATWPNRFFMMAASSGGLDHSPYPEQIGEWETIGGFAFEHGSLFQALTSSQRRWRIYHGDRGPLSGSIPVSGGLKGVQLWDPQPYSRFAADVSTFNYPFEFTLIEPNYGDIVSNTYRGGTSQHPLDDVRAGELLIKTTYEAIRNSPLWNTSLLIVTWDEHGGFYDHVGAVPGGAPSPGDRIVTPGKVNDYGFTQYGPRVPAVIVSPLIPRNLIDHRTYDHASIPATVERIFRFPPRTQRDAKALDVTPLVSLLQPRPTPARLPNPAPAPPTERAAVAPAAAAGDDEPFGEGNVAGFLHVAMRYDLAMSPPSQREEIIGRVTALRTRGEARAYLEDVARRAATAKPVLAAVHGSEAQLQRAGTAADESVTGASFGAFLSPANGTARLITQWSVRIEARHGGWSGSLTSAAPEAVLQAPGESGMFDVTVIASGPNLAEKQLTPVQGSRADVGCGERCRALVGIVASPDGTDAEYWTTSDAVCEPGAHPHQPGDTAAPGRPLR
jgi:phospholipase C